MASKISTDPSVFFVNFRTGNDAGDPDSNFVYAEDEDSNWVEVRDKYNSLVDEVVALGGSGALLNFDLIHLDDPLGPDGQQTSGVIGRHSYFATLASADAELKIAAGVAILPGNQRVSQIATATFVTAPFVGTNYVALDSNGVPSLQQNLGSKSLDIWQVQWNGSIFSAIVRWEPPNGIASILMDGDDWRSLRQRAAVTSSFSAKQFDTADQRLNAVERILGGVTTDFDGDAIGPLALDASWITTGVLAHERGGLEFDASAVVDGDFLVGTGAGAMGLEAGATARTTMGLGTGDTPQFTRLGLGAPADGTAELLITGTSTLAMTAGGAFMFSTTDARDIEFLRGASLRIDMNAGGLSLHDSAGNIVIQISAADTALIGGSGDSLGFMGASAIGRPAVTGVLVGATLGELEGVVTSLIAALEAASGLGLLTDSTT